jgi:hypothetical protein
MSWRGLIDKESDPFDVSFVSGSGVSGAGLLPSVVDLLGQTTDGRKLQLNTLRQSCDMGVGAFSTQFDHGQDCQEQQYRTAE